MEQLNHIWPKCADLAADLGLPYSTVRSWADRGIPARRYLDIVLAAEARGHTLSFERLDEVSEAMRSGAAPLDKGKVA